MGAQHIPQGQETPLTVEHRAFHARRQFKPRITGTRPSTLQLYLCDPRSSWAYLIFREESFSLIGNVNFAESRSFHVLDHRAEHAACNASTQNMDGIPQTYCSTEFCWPSHAFPSHLRDKLALAGTRTRFARTFVYAKTACEASKVHANDCASSRESIDGPDLSVLRSSAA